MFERKDAVPALFLLLLIFAIIVTLSQILVVHQHNHRNLKPKRDSRKFNAMLKQLEITIDAMMKANILTQEKYERALMAQIYASRVRKMLGALERNNVRPQVEMTSTGLNYVFKAKDWKARVLQNTAGNQKIPHQRSSNTDKNHKLNNLKTNNTNRNHISDLTEYRNTNKEKKTKYFPNNNTNSNQKQQSYPIENDNANRKQKTTLTENKLTSVNHKTHHIENTISGGTQKTNQNNSSIEHKSHLTETNKSSRNQKSTQMRVHNSDIGENQETNHKENNDTRTMHNSLPKRHGSLTRRLMNDTVSTHAVRPLRLQTDAKELNKTSGRYSMGPNDCVAKHRVAIVIPYRDRREHLETLLYHLIPILKRQQLDFRIFVIEQHGNETFNKGRLMNAGFIEAWKISDFNCFVFHDVDLIPENDQNMYTCPLNNPRHMSVAVDKFNYSLPYQRLVGGVFSIRREHFLKVNGYSNLYWGWGAEDDDMALRLKEVGLSISRPPTNVARYKMIKHNDREKIPFQWTYYLLRTLRKRFRKDGLNSLSYKLISMTDTETYTHVIVDIGAPPKKPIAL